MEVSRRNKVVKLLWTGGWDSTFRLLQLIFEEKKEVQPIYIIDQTRSSWTIEMKTIREIKNFIVNKYPESVHLLEPTFFFSKVDIKYDPFINEAWNRIKKERHIGKQYQWLAMFCKQLELNNIELSIQKHTRIEHYSIFGSQS